MILRKIIKLVTVYLFFTSQTFPCCICFSLCDAAYDYFDEDFAEVSTYNKSNKSNKTSNNNYNQEAEIFRSILKKAYNDKSIIISFVDDLLELYEKSGNNKKTEKIIKKLIPFKDKYLCSILDEIFYFTSNKIIGNVFLNDNFLTKQTNHGSINDVKNLIKDVGINEKDNIWTNSFIYWLLISENIEALIYLFDLGLNPDETLCLKCDKGFIQMPLLHVAILYNCPKSIDLLLIARAKTDSLDSDSNTPLMIASFVGDIKTVTMLLKSKINKDFSNTDKMTALHFAAIANNVEVLKLLVENGANINLRNYENKTALLLAAQRGSFQALEYLLSVMKEISKEEKLELIKLAQKFLDQKQQEIKEFKKDLINAEQDRDLILKSYDKFIETLNQKWVINIS